MKTEKVGIFIVLVMVLSFLYSCSQAPLMSIGDGNNSKGQQTPAILENNLDIIFIDENNAEIPNMRFELTCTNPPNVIYNETSSHIAERDNGKVIFTNIENGDYQITITDPDYLLIRIKKNIDGGEETVSKLTPCAEPGTEKYFIVVRAI